MSPRQHEVRLRDAGLRATPQRLLVLEALEGRRTAVSAQELHHELRQQERSPGLATIYRTLQALAEADEADTFTRDGEVTYRLCGAHHHHHLVCESCGSVQEVEAEQIESWVKAVARRTGFVVTGHTADVYGVCRDCR
jgi:Fur family transcriptional regulator, ferric uptake regulator